MRKDDMKLMDWDKFRLDVFGLTPSQEWKPGAFRPAIRNQEAQEELTYKVMQFLTRNRTLINDFDDKDVKKRKAMEAQFFMNGVSRVRGRHEYQYRNIAQFMSDTPNYPEVLSGVYEKIDIIEPFDRSFEILYKPVPVDNGGVDVVTSKANIFVENILPGGSIKYGSSGASKYRVYCVRRGGGVLISGFLVLERNYYQIEQDLFALRRAMDVELSLIHNGLIEAPDWNGLGLRIAWQPLEAGYTGPHPTAQRDLNTIEYAAVKLIEKWQQNAGVLPQGENTTFVVYVPWQLKARMQKALSLLDYPFLGSTKSATYNFVLASTTMLSTTNKRYGYVAIPGVYTIRGEQLAPTMMSVWDQDTYSWKYADWWSGLASIGEVEQFIQFDTQ